MRKKKENKMEFEPSLDKMQECFVKFNRLYFGNKLPMPKFLKESPSNPFLGSTGYSGPGDGNCNIKINFSKKIPWTQELFEDVMLHEMVHLYLTVRYWVGRWIPFTHFHILSLFWLKVKWLNLRYGLNISAYYGNKELGELRAYCKKLEERKKKKPKVR